MSDFFETESPVRKSDISGRDISGHAVRRYACVTSTMDVARGAPAGTVIVANEQTAGRGRATHTWFSPPGQSLYVSIVLHPPLCPAQAGWVTMLAALAVVDVLEELAHTAPAAIPVTLKWFNDVLLNGRKVCGILVENAITGESLDEVIVGIGLNVNTVFDTAPAEVRTRATSLLHAFQQVDPATSPFDREDILQCLLARFDQRYADLLQSRRSPVDEYARHVETLGQEVHIDIGSSIIAGRAMRIADDGALIVRTADGERRVSSGEVLT